MTAFAELPVREWGVRIGGGERSPTGDRFIERTMPGRPERPVGVFRFAGPADVDDAVRTVAAAQVPWAALRPKGRSEVLSRAARLLHDRRDELAAWECLESGMLIGLARQHALWCVELLEFSAGLARTLSGRTVDLGAGKLGLVLPEPVPVVAALGPWNFPLSELIWKVAPALGAGCGVVMKPSELTPVSSFLLDEVLHEAGVPEGLTAVLAGDGEVGAALSSHPGVGLVSLTGGVATGRAVVRAAAEHLTPTLMELGGKSAIVVLPGADPAEAARIVAPAVGFRTGQACTCPSRVVAVGDGRRADAVGEALAAELGRLVMGPPDALDTTLGPAISRRHAARVRGFVDEAAGAGATLLGSRDEPGPEFLAPSVVMGADPSQPVVREEVFGPVTAVLQAPSVDAALRIANDTRYGLAAGVISGGDLDTAVALARGLRAGTVWIDEWGAIELELPFGGVGLSGFGRELGPEGLEAFVTWKSVHLPHREVPT
ncbi:MAG TPA: aldehyde dehydrogenase family protein [Actinomycetota bacterium]|nr:aldehyde dehydrogenase family protein [Actinomycetota bacterium]